MDTHVQRLGLLSIIFGVIGSFGALLTLWYFGGIAPLFNAAEEQRLGLIVSGLVSAHLIFGIPCIGAGYFLRRYENWARLAMISLCGLNLLIPPAGTALGLYGLWVLMMPETDPLFIDKERRPKPASARRSIAQPRAQNDHTIPHGKIKTAQPHLPE